MRRYATGVVLALFAMYFTFTGFQCGSAETTSARLYIQQKQFDKAEESLTKEVAKNDKNEEAWFLLGQVRIELKKYVQANDAYNKALSLSDVHKKEIMNNKLALWQQMTNEGINAFNKGKEAPAHYDTAIVRFTTASTFVPDSANTYYLAALAQYAKKDYGGALAGLDIALQKNPKYVSAARLLGQVHYFLGEEKKEAKDDAGAIAAFKKSADAFHVAYTAEPLNPENITALIDAYERSNQSDKALSLTKSCVDADPNNRICRYAFGVYLLKQNEYGKAVEQLKAVLDIDPASADEISNDATYNLGVGYLNWGVAMKAESDKKAEAAMKAGKGSSYKEDLAYREKYKMSIPYLEKSAEVKKDDANLWLQLGKVYTILSMTEKSKEAFKKADALMKGN
jgi:tetratricopeptide (TPR) repeat protein